MNTKEILLEEFKGDEVITKSINNNYNVELEEELQSSISKLEGTTTEFESEMDKALKKIAAMK